jgi:malic enzyme
MWTLSDSTGIFRQEGNQDRIDNAIKQRWRDFNSLENQDIQRIQKEELGQILAAEALKTVDRREKGLVYSPEIGAMVGSWKVPEAETLNRTFNEGARYYAMPF